jgi:histidinol-phosphate aminotransferase
MGDAQVFVDGLRAEVRNLPPYNAGLSGEYVRAHYQVEEIAKLGSNENPFGTSPRVLSAIAAAVPEAALYPDAVCDGLRTALSLRLGVAPERLVFGNGSEDLIAISAHTFLSPDDEFVTILPSFGLHVLHAQALGARVRGVTVRPDYTLDVEEFVSALTPRTRMVIWSNPSNPLGTSITADEMGRLLSVVPDNTLLVFDEAYFEYAAADSAYPAFLPMLEQCRAPWLLLRTFSKAYGLAGMRVGYGIASDPALVHLMDRIRSPFNVNRLAQVAAIAALEDLEHVQDCVSRTVAERERLTRALNELGYHSAPSRANFVFFDTREDSTELSRRLLSYGVIVKPWREPGFCGHIRVSVGAPRANDQFLAALKEATCSKAK